MRSTHLIRGLFVLVLLIAAAAEGAEVSNRRYYEDFSTREYCDLENTTAFWARSSNSTSCFGRR